jgi:hypothetical protein
MFIVFYTVILHICVFDLFHITLSLWHTNPWNVCTISNVQNLKFGESLVRSAVFIIIIIVVEVVIVAVVVPPGRNRSLVILLDFLSNKYYVYYCTIWRWSFNYSFGMVFPSLLSGYQCWTSNMSIFCHIPQEERHTCRCPVWRVSLIWLCIRYCFGGRNALQFGRQNVQPRDIVPPSMQ